MDSEFDSREMGSLAHQLLAEFYRRLKTDTPHCRVTPEHRAEALAYFDEIARLFNEDTARGGSAATALAVARATAWARSTISRDALFLPSFAPVLVEAAFGTERTFRFAGADFCGRIDRIDAREDSIFVIDYKSSREVPGLARFEQEGKVQAVIYALAAEASTGLPAAGSVYRSMTSGRTRGFWRRDLLGETPFGMHDDDGIGEAEYAELLVATEERVAAAIDGMNAGRVEARAHIKGACSWCAVRALCAGVE
jgi:hypothetical protein